MQQQQTNKQKLWLNCGQTRQQSNEAKTIRQRETRTLWNFIATNGGISRISAQARAIWGMICNKAFCIRATNSRTRIDTFHIYAGLCHWTIAIHDAFGATFNVRITIILWQTCARTSVIFFTAFRIDSAWICLARRYFGLMIDYKIWNCERKLFDELTHTDTERNLEFTWNWRTRNERITSISVWTTARGLMIVTTADRLRRTTTNTWIDTTFIYTG